MYYICSVCAVPLYSTVSQEAESEDLVARNVDCVDSGEDLYREFLRRGSASGRYLFDVHTPGKQFYVTYTTFTVVFNTAIVNDCARENTTAVCAHPLIASDRCCRPFNEGCIFFQAAIQSAYLHLPPQLVYKLGAAWFTLFGQQKGSPVNEFIGCWSPPPFCNQSKDSKVRSAIIGDFAVILVGHPTIIHGI